MRIVASKIERCPYCEEGTVEITREGRASGRDVFWVGCRECGARGPRLYVLRRALEEWNSVSLRASRGVKAMEPSEERGSDTSSETYPWLMLGVCPDVTPAASPWCPTKGCGDVYWEEGQRILVRSADDMLLLEFVEGLWVGDRGVDVYRSEELSETFREWALVY